MKKYGFLSLVKIGAGSGITTGFVAQIHRVKGRDQLAVREMAPPRCCTSSPKPRNVLQPLREKRNNRESTANNVFLNMRVFCQRTGWDKTEEPRGFLCFETYLTRETYSPERVSTLITSPIWTNNGTLTTAPVLRVAGLPPVPAVSPVRPGSVSVISASMKFGG